MVKAKNIGFLPSTQMLPPHLLRFKKMRKKNTRFAPIALSLTHSCITLFFFFFPFLVFGWPGSGDPPT
jgi:hypothetical protein